MDINAKVTLVKQFLEGLGTRNMPALRAILAEDITWTLPGTSRISGTARGVEAVMERIDRITGSGVHMELKDILIGLTDVTLSLHNTAKVDGRELDERLSTVCIIREGRIAEIQTYLSDVDGVNRFFV